MNQQDFTYILQNPKSISPLQTEAIKSVIEEFPYLQSARAVYLKGLKNQSSLKYNKELKITAAYTTDRSILFDFITSKDFIQNEISEQITQNIANLNNDVLTENNIDDKKTEAEEDLNQEIPNAQHILDSNIIEPEEVSPKSEIIKDETNQPPDNILNLGKPLLFDKNEKHSFSEWLNLTRIKPINRETADLKSEKEEEKTDIEKAKKFELIDKFITANPKIDPTKTTQSKGNLAKAQMIQPESLMTETLARIYVEQKNYKSAIQSYRILSLKYPEKSSFFATQIEAIKQLQEQNNIS